MYERKLREIFDRNKEKAKQALDAGDAARAASHYEKCGDILAEQAKNKRGTAREEKEELAEKYYEISRNLSGKSDSLKEKYEPSGGGGSPEEDQDFSEYVQRFIEDSDVTWDDVAGLRQTKQAIKESFALSAIQDKPAAVDSINSILLYGPPGTGKTLLASAMAGSNDFPFFNVRVSHALSKYYGESGKIISQIFDAASERSPSVMFFDEIDSIALSRGGSLDESTRRVLSTLLTELSGFDQGDEDLMFVAATNAPWDMDTAVLSRLERAVYVPLPDERTIKKIITLNTADQGVSIDCDLDRVASRAADDLFSGREVKNLAKEAVRSMVNDMNPELDRLADRSVEAVQEYELSIRPLTMDDFEDGFAAIDPKTTEDLLQRYEEWGDKFGR